MSFYTIKENLFRNSLRDTVQYPCYRLMTSSLTTFQLLLNFMSLLCNRDFKGIWFSNWARGNLKPFYVVIGSGCLHLGSHLDSQLTWKRDLFFSTCYLIPCAVTFCIWHDFILSPFTSDHITLRQVRLSSIQLFRKTLSDVSVKRTRQDLLIVWDLNGIFHISTDWEEIYKFVFLQVKCWQ